jgi:hypothetical protein
MSDTNEWELSSGLALDGATVDIESVEFGYNANLGAGVMCANFKVVDIESGEEIEQSFSVGSGWDTTRDGSQLVSDKPKKINKNTNYGILIESALEIIGIENAASVLGGSPKEAAIWPGTRWSFGTVKMKRVNPTTGAESEKDVFVFTEYHGASEEEPEPEPEPAKPAATRAGGARKAIGTRAGGARKATGASKAAASNGVAEGVDEELWDELVELARGSEDHDAFLEAALDIEAVEGNKAAQKAVMGTKPGSVWAAR